MFYILDNNGKVLFADDQRQRLLDTIAFMPQYLAADIREGELEIGYDGRFYLSGYAPQKSSEEKAAEIRETRDRLLTETDRYMLSDYPITEEERERYRQYRQYLRDIPSAADFPELEVKTFSQWEKNGWTGA